MIVLTKIYNFSPYLHNHSNFPAYTLSTCSCLTPFSLNNVYQQCHLSRLCKTHKLNMRGLRNWVLQTPPKARSSKAISENGWEDPDGYDSEDEASDKVEALSQGFSAVDGEDNTQQLIKEVELMLNPEERASLQKNEAPDFSKLSSPKWIPLHTLATSGQILLVDDLLKHGFDVNSVDKYGLTALQKVVLYKKEAVVSRLLKRGADPHVRDKDGATLLHYAVLVGASQTLKLLIKHNLDVNLADNEGWTPLHLAVQSRVRDVARILLLNGADKTAKNKDGNTPFDVAISLGKGFKTYEITKLLKLVPATNV